MEVNGVQNEALILAYQKGYRVTEDGRLLNPKGIQLKPLMCKGRNYPTFNVVVGDKKYYIRIHRFAAYCFYGNAMFEKGVLVRHLDGNVMNFSKNNIALGTQADNMNDISDEKKKELTQKRREWCLKTGKVPPPQYKWKEKDVKKIMALMASGYTTREVGEMLNIPHNTVWYINDRERRKSAN